MSELFDDISRIVGSSITRREILKRIASALAGVGVAPLALKHHYACATTTSYSPQEVVFCCDFPNGSTHCFLTTDSSACTSQGGTPHQGLSCCAGAGSQNQCFDPGSPQQGCCEFTISGGTGCATGFLPNVCTKCFQNGTWHPDQKCTSSGKCCPQESPVACNGVCCGIHTPICSNDVCVQCASDGDCPSGYHCASGTCKGKNAVQFVGFTATHTSNGVLLKWQTGHEVDNLGLVIIYLTRGS